MLTLELDNQAENLFSKLLELHGNNYSNLINSMYDYRINEIKKGIRNIELDFLFFEKKYGMTTEDFFKNYEIGKFGEQSHLNDFMIWSSEYESYLSFQVELKKLL